LGGFSFVSFDDELDVAELLEDCVALVWVEEFHDG
jgi:hypothetical protein